LEKIIKIETRKSGERVALKSRSKSWQ